MADASGFEARLNFEEFAEDFRHVIHYLEKQKNLMDAHMVDFFTLDHWESILPQQTREDLELLASEQVQIVSLPNAFDQKSEIVKNCGESLRQFLTEAAQAQLKSFSWLRQRQDFLSNCRVNFISHIMAPKKSYEVEIMSNVINTLATQFQVSKVHVGHYVFYYTM